MCSALGKPEWLDDPRFTDRRERSKHAAVVQEAMLALLAKMTMQEVIAHFTEHDVVAAPVNTIPQAAQDPHPWERRAMVEVPDFLAGSIAVSGDFWHFSRTPRPSLALPPKWVSTTRRCGPRPARLLRGRHL